MERKLRVGEILNESFAIYRDQAGVLIPVAFWLFLAVAIVEAVAAGDLLLGSLAVVLSLAVSTLYQGMVVGLVDDIRDGRRDYSIGELMRSVAPVVLPLLGAGFLAGIGIVGGFFLLVVPGLYLLTVWAVIAPVIVVERRKVFGAFGRSRQLVRDNGWPVRAPESCPMDWDATSYDPTAPHCIRNFHTGFTLQNRPENWGIHSVGQIWSQALWEIRLGYVAQGRSPEAWDTTLIASQFDYAPGTTFQAAAKATYEEALVRDGARAARLVRDRFAARGITF